MLHVCQFMLCMDCESEIKIYYYYIIIIIQFVFHMPTNIMVDFFYFELLEFFIMLLHGIVMMIEYQCVQYLYA